MKMATTFKVVEFYRNNSSFLNSSLDHSNGGLNTTNSSYALANDLAKTPKSPTNGISKESSPPGSQSARSTSDLLYNSLGFNVLGGYLTNMPATIVDISSSLNSKLVKVEEGDIILEINGLSTRHLSLSEIYKQLRCCGNRVLLRLKSDPEYKSRFRDIVNQLDKDPSSASNSQVKSFANSPQSAYNNNNNVHSNGYRSPGNNFSSSDSNKTPGIGGYLLRNASKSYDNNINTYASYGGANSFYMTHSSTSSNVSSAANSHSNILDTSPSANEGISSYSNGGPLKLQHTKSLPTSNSTDSPSTSTSLLALPISQRDQRAPVPEQAKPDLEPASQRTEIALAAPSSSSTSSPSTSSTSSTQSTNSSATQMPSNDYSWSTSHHHAEHNQSKNNANIILTKVNHTEQMNNFQNEIELENDRIVLNNQFIDDPNVTGIAKSNQLQSSNTNNSSNQQAPPQITPVMSFQVEIDDSIKRKIDEKLKECSSGDSDSDSETNVYTPKAVDLPSAQRLAKRLYYLDGFRANDVVRHLCKKNDFSQLVADEYLKLFNFQSLTLDAALRKFLKQFQLVGDPHEKERVLMYFAKSYVDANNTAFNDVDSCHTLTCALMLLNTDLHDSKVQNKMKLNEFIENLKGLNNGGNFPDVLLESLYTAIKNEPLECACLDGDDLYDDRNGNVNGNGNFSLRPNGSNPFIQLPDPQTAKEYKFGWLLRKCCIDSDGKKAPFLKRSWKMFYASLRDMVLYLHKDDKSLKNNTFDNITNAIRIHHAYASIAVDYKKKQFVFRLKTADWAEYLFQTSNSNELYDWVSTINLVAAMFSSPPLPGAIGSNKTFQRPLLPVSKTRYTLQEQFEYHKKHLKQIQCDLVKLEMAAGASQNHTLHHNSSSLTKDEKHFDKDKYNYLQFEIQRYKTYVNLLEEKILSESAINATTAVMPPMNMINPTFVLNDNAANPMNNTTSHLNSHQFHQLIPTNNSHAYTNHLNHMNALHNSHHHIMNNNNINNNANSSNANVSLLSSNIHQFLSYPNDYASSKSMPSTPTHAMMNGAGMMRNSIQSVNYNGTMGAATKLASNITDQLTPTSAAAGAGSSPGHNKLNNYLD